MGTDRRVRWTEDDDKAVLALKASGASTATIAQKLGRSGTSISSRFAHLKRQRRLARLKIELKQE